MIKDNQENIIHNLQPKQTLYIRNINEKIKPKDMKYALYCLMEAYGQILQIIVKKNNQLRGQAFVVFRQITAATAVKNNLNGYAIFGKAMRIDYTRKRSLHLDFDSYKQAQRQSHKQSLKY